jgi:hypothetical protein
MTTKHRPTKASHGFFGVYETLLIARGTRVLNLGFNSVVIVLELLPTAFSSIVFRVAFAPKRISVASFRLSVSNFL